MEHEQLIIICLVKSTLVRNSIPVQGENREARWVLKKYHHLTLKSNTQWFWCLPITMHESFLMKP